MQRAVWVEFKRGFVLFSVIFAVTTILSSALQLASGQPADTNFHILNRAAIVLIVVITIGLFNNIQLKNPFLAYFVPYVLSLAVVFVYVWLTGFVEPIHPNGFRDVFLNFTAVAVCIMLVIFIRNKWQQKHS